MDEKINKILETLAESVCVEALEGVTDTDEKARITKFMVVVITMFFEVAILGWRRFGLNINKVIHIFHITSHAFDVINDDVKKELGL
jgi:hypothetical protein